MKVTIRIEREIDCNVNTCGKCSQLATAPWDRLTAHCDLFHSLVLTQGTRTISYVRLPQCRDAARRVSEVRR